MSRMYAPVNEVLNGGFEITDLILLSRKPIEITKVNDNEVYAVYCDVDNADIRYKQTWTAEGTGNTRTNPLCKIEKSTDGGTSWRILYEGL